jgi:sugar lactone lactonase YvrE
MISYPNELLFDSAGNMIIADGGNAVIRKVDVSGIITTIAGTGVFGDTGDGGPATQADIGQAWGMALDRAGNLYFTDVGNCVVRKIDTAGIINTVAGNFAAGCGYNGDGILATTAQLNLPRGIAVDPSGNIYIADTSNHRVREVNTSGIISTFAGTGNSGFSGDGGLATQANIGNPRGLAYRQGLLYIANAGNSRIRTVNASSGIINTYLGSSFGYDGDNNPLLSTMTTGGTHITFSRTGSLIFSDAFNSRVRSVAGTVVKTSGGGFIGDGGMATSGALVQPVALAFDKSGNYYIADGGGNRVRKVSAGGKIVTVAGTGVSGYGGDGGAATSAKLFYPAGVTVDGAGNLYIADSFNGVVRKVDTSGIITTFASDPNFSGLWNMASDTAGNLYVADNGSCVIWKITSGGTVSVVAGSLFLCSYAGDRGPATSAQLNAPYGVAVDSKGNIYIGDSGNNRIRKVIASTGIITTLAGNGTCGFSGDGGPATAAELCFPLGVTVDTQGNVSFADELNVRIRKVSQGVISTVGGSGLPGYNGDALPALSTNIDDPVGVAVNRQNVLYFVDDEYVRVRQIH